MPLFDNKLSVKTKETKHLLKLVIAGCLIVPVVGQTFQSVQRQAGMPVLPPSLADQIVRYPSAEVAFICGPQLKAGSRLNPFPWFDTTAIKQGISHGEKAPRVAPFGPMLLIKRTNDMNYRASGRYLVWRLATRQPGAPASRSPNRPSGLLKNPFRI